MMYIVVVMAFIVVFVSGMLFGKIYTLRECAKALRGTGITLVSMGKEYK